MLVVLVGVLLLAGMPGTRVLEERLFPRSSDAGFGSELALSDITRCGVFGAGAFLQAEMSSGRYGGIERGNNLT